MNTLFKVNINWAFFWGFCIFVYLLFPNLSWYSYAAICITFYQFLLFFHSIGTAITVRYLFGALMCLQMLLGPTFAYNGLDKFQVGRNTMQIPEAQYFAYVIPAVLCFILGLHITNKRLEGEIVDREKISLFVDRNPQLPYVLIVIGFVASVVASFFSSDLAFVFYLFGGFKYIGAFMLILGNKRLKIIPLLIVYGSIVASSLGDAMFHDLIIWVIFLSTVLAIKYKPKNWIKLLLVFFLVILAVVTQLAKGDYRTALGEKGAETGLQTFTKAYEESQGEGNLIDLNSLAKNNLRINQGYIITNIMKTVPSSVPFQNGAELRLIIESAILPRILAPDKLNAGDQALFIKYTGMQLNKITSMGLSSVGDGYINFGEVGGCIFMFFLGLLYSEVLKAFKRYSKNFPVLLLFVPLVFYYPIRPDCELQTILGHLVKSCFLIFVIFLVWKNYFKLSTPIAEKDIHPHPLVPSRL